MLEWQNLLLENSFPRIILFIHPPKITQDMSNSTPLIYFFRDGHEWLCQLLGFAPTYTPLSSGAVIFPDPVFSPFPTRPAKLEHFQRQPTAL